MFSVFWSAPAKKQFSKIDKSEQKNILAKLERLRTGQSCDIHELQGTFKGLSRLRAGKYRVVYHKDDIKFEILIVKVGKRGDIYE